MLVLSLPPLGSLILLDEVALTGLLATAAVVVAVVVVVAAAGMGTVVGGAMVVGVVVTDDAPTMPVCCTDKSVVRLPEDSEKSSGVFRTGGTIETSRK